MPIFDYKCPTCNQPFEVLVRRGSGPPKCPKGCEATPQRQVSKAAFHLSGDGWASDGYKGKKTGGSQ